MIDIVSNSLTRQLRVQFTQTREKPGILKNPGVMQPGIQFLYLKRNAAWDPTFCVATDARANNTTAADLEIALV